MFTVSKYRESLRRLGLDPATPAALNTLALTALRQVPREAADMYEIEIRVKIIEFILLCLGQGGNLPHFAWGLGKVSQSAWGIGHSAPLCLGHQTFCPTLPGATFVAWPTLPGAQKCAYFAWGNTHFAPLCLGHPGGRGGGPKRGELAPRARCSLLPLLPAGRSQAEKRSERPRCQVRGLLCLSQARAKPQRENE